MSPSVSSAMRFLQLLLRATPATLLLLLCLQLRVSEAQESTTRRRELIFKSEIPTIARANEEITVTLRLETELRESMVVKTYLLSNVPIEGGFNYKYTRCISEDSPATFFWDFNANRTARIAVVADIIREKGICPEDLAVVPIKENRFYALQTLFIV